MKNIFSKIKEVFFPHDLRRDVDYMSFCFVLLISLIVNVYISLFSHFQLVGGVFDLEARFTIKDSSDLIILLELLEHCNVSLKVRKLNSTF